MSIKMNKRREFLKKTAYIAPAVITMSVIPSLAKSGSGQAPIKKMKPLKPLPVAAPIKKPKAGSGAAAPAATKKPKAGV